MVEHLIRNEEVAGSIPAGGSTEFANTMDKELIKELIKGVAADRPVLLLSIGQIIAGLLFALIIGLSIHVSDVTVYTRYTAFGEAHFYKSPWQYLLLFLMFGLIVTIIHSVLLVKLHQMGRRQTAIFIGWMGIIIVLIALIYTLAVMSLGRAT